MYETNAEDVVLSLTNRWLDLYNELTKFMPKDQANAEATKLLTDAVKCSESLAGIINNTVQEINKFKC